MTLSRTALMLWIAAVAAPAADTVPADLFPPGARILFGLSVRSLVDSPLLQNLGGKPGALTANFAALPLRGMDPLKDIDSAILASTGGDRNAPALVVLQGRFHPERTAGAHLYKGIPVFENTGGDKAALALLDGATAIAGALADVRAAIDRRRASSAAAPALASRIPELADRYDIWGVGDVPEGFHTANPAAKDFDSIDRFEFGASLRDGLQAHAEFHLRSPEQAAKMAASLQMLELLMKAQQPPSAGMKFDLHSANGTLTLAVFIPEAELKKGIAARRDALNGMLLGTHPGAPPAVRAPTPAVIVTNDRGDTVTVKLPGGK